MRPLVIFMRRTILGGVLLLLPLALVLFLIGHLVVILTPLASKIAQLVGGVELGPLWLTTIIALALVASAFLAGLFATTQSGRALIDRLETLVLNRVPGYSFIKSAAADAASSAAAIDESQRKKAVLVGDAGGWQIGFVTGRVDDRTSAVFIPEAPSCENGTLVFVGTDRLVESGLSASEALSCIRRMGVNPPKLRLEPPPAVAVGGSDPSGGVP
jgi:uncharacterized membrane protein